MPIIRDLSGMTFGMLKVVSRAYSNHYGWHYVCDCKCGGRSVVRGSNLTSGHTSSCGCQVPAGLLLGNGYREDYGCGY